MTTVSTDPSGNAATRSLLIRLARPDEYDEVGRLTETSYLASYDTLTPEYRQSLRDAAARAALGDIWIASDEGGSILGTVWVARTGEHLSELAQDGEVDFRQLAVTPEARGRGVGEALTRHILALARDRGAHRVVMNSGPEMTGAHALYAKIGFRRLTEREGPIEVEEGRWIDLLAFGYDLSPTDAAAPADVVVG
ncbi:GNAT family N-acetyltransferase [uncultured Microbacterium sp.]|uniref:GNAT family N-acetyltransferase n=1 Tax=uncultured Microbacterium sp. TaxID=191216 RepID=UPI0035C973A6